ncbi:MAG: PKD domain-containing protein [Cyclobacteriaceae bacterium]|nr:PKD domain-containing protein [Cyclobacteriaceae bacterium]
MKTSITVRFSIILLFILVAINAYGQLSVDFESKGTICLNEVVSFSNKSIDSESYIWDFCFESLSQTPVLKVAENNIVGASAPEGIEVIQDRGRWYSIVISRDNGLLFLLNFLEGLDKAPSISQINVQGVSINNAKDLRLINENGSWYALLAGYSNNNVYRLAFGESLENSPIATNLGNIGGWNNIRGIDLAKDGEDVVALISSFSNNRLAIIRFKGGITNNPVLPEDVIIANNMTLGSGLMGISVIKSENSWYGLIASFSNNRVLLLNFGTSLFSNPTVSLLPIQTSLSSPTSVSLQKEGHNFFLYIMQRNNGLVRASFGSIISDQILQETNIGNFAGNLSDIFAFRLFKNTPTWSGMTISANSRRVTLLSFPEGCANQLLKSSTEFEPFGLSFNNPGNYPIELTAIGENGNRKNMIKEITVLDQPAPQLNIDFSQSLCSSTPTQLSSQSDLTLSSLNWSLGDGSEYDIAAPTHQFAEAGAYTVRLDAVAENGCSNFTQKEINIYNPPEPDFEFEEDVVCSNAPLALNNTSTHDAPDSLLSWLWDFNEEGTDNTRDPSFTFPQGGDKEVTLTAAIPGCEASISKNIFITAGPQVDFSFAGNCLNEPFTFENLTTGERITGYQWDFADGYFAEVTNPIHEFEEPGTFPVNLKAQNEEGCRTEITKNVFVRDVPNINFEWELPCRSNPVQIYDRSTVRLANIAQRNWTWSGPGGESATATNLQNPFFTPQSAGTYQLKLKATSNFGCADSLTQNIQVLPAPLADFSTERLCTGQSALFEAQVDYPEGSITRYDWLIDGTLYTGPSVTRTFNQARAFNASLLVRADNLCESVVNKSLQIFPTPTVSIAHTALCNNQDIRFTPVVSSIDPVAQYTWSVNNVPSGQEQIFVRRFATPGSRNIALQVNTLNGCQGRMEQPFDIAQSPIAAFEPLPSQGARPLRVQFENTSQFADSYRWFFRESAGQGSSAANPEFIYTEEATERAMLIAENTAGCADTAFAFIEIMKPLLDVALMRISTQTTGDRLQFNLDIENRGSVVIEDMDILADLGGSLQLYEKMNRRLFSGERIDYPLAYSLRQLDYQEIHHVCFTLIPNVSGLEDVNPVDNKDCLTLSGSFQMLDLYPNPVTDRVYIPFVMPSRETLQFRILDSRGNLVADKSYPGLRTGLNVIQWETASLNSGVYLIQLTHDGKSLVKKMVVR